MKTMLDKIGGALIALGVFMGLSALLNLKKAPEKKPAAKKPSGFLIRLEDMNGFYQGVRASDKKTVWTQKVNDGARFRTTHDAQLVIDQESLTGVVIVSYDDIPKIFGTW